MGTPRHIYGEFNRTGFWYVTRLLLHIHLPVNKRIYIMCCRVRLFADTHTFDVLLVYVCNRIECVCEKFVYLFLSRFRKV